MKIKQHKQLNGFTLVEILVVLGLFSSIATLSLGTLFNVQSINLKLQESQTVLDNLNLSTQTILRDIKFGSEFYCSTVVPTSTESVPSLRKNCSSTDQVLGTVLVFRPADSVHPLDRSAYFVNNKVLYKTEYPNGGEMRTLQMTSNEVEVTGLTFYVEGALTSDPLDGFNYAGGSDYQQPLVTLILSGFTKPSKSSFAPTDFTIQTSVSARELDTK